MPQRDYVLRLIEQAAAVLRALLERMRGDGVKRDDVLAELKRAAFLGSVDLDLLRVLAPDAVRMIVLQLGQADPSRIWFAAEVLYVDGLSAESAGDLPAARASFEKAMMLYGMVEPTVVLPGGFPELGERVQDIEARLGEDGPAAA